MALQPELLLEMLNKSASGILMVDVKGHITYCNPYINTLFGYTENDLIGRSIDCLVPEEFRQQHHAYVEDAVKTRQSRNMGDGNSFPAQHADGHTFYISVNLTPSDDQQHMIVTVTETTRHMSAQQEAQKHIERVQMLLETTTNIARLGVWELDLASGSLWWSDEVYRIHGLPIGSDVDVENAINFYAPEARPVITNAVDAGIKAGKPWDEKLPFITAQGRHIWVRAVGYADYVDGDPVALRGAFQDITDLKHAEQEAIAANVAKSEFLANMSHEIRTPLNGVLGINQLLMNTQLNAKQLEYAELISASGKSLLAIINDILDMSKIEAGQLVIHPKTFNLREVIQQLVETTDLQIKEQGKPIRMSLNCSDDIADFVETDPDRLKQILSNMLSNALKFTESGEIKVDVTRDQERLLFRVSDTGIGIKQDDLDALFDKFTQVDGSSTRAAGGTGLGLSICKDLVQLLGGNIGVDSQVHRGSTFRFDLPYVAKDDDFDMSVPLVTLNVMLVCNHPEVIEQWKECAAIQELHIHEAHSAPEALKRLQALDDISSIDAVVVYDDIPGMNGIEFIKVLKQRESFQSMPVFFVDRQFISGNLELCEQLGLNGYFSEQESLNDIVSALHGTEIDYAPFEDLPTNSQSPLISVLVVEDNEINQLVAMEMLKNLGCSVALANNGEEALKMVEADIHGYAMILMDCQMPIMDGFVATERLRLMTEESNPDLPIIALTANAMDQDVIRCFEVGMNDHVAKPVSIEALKRALERWTDWSD